MKQKNFNKGEFQDKLVEVYGMTKGLMCMLELLQEALEHSHEEDNIERVDYSFMFIIEQFYRILKKQNVLIDTYERSIIQKIHGQ